MAGMPTTRLCLSLLAALLSSTAYADDMAGMPGMAAPPPQSAPAAPPDTMGDMDMSGMKHDMAAMPGMAMPSTGILGSYPMSRDASGTSWQPDVATHSGIHLMADDWMLMAHLRLTAIYDMQDGPRGENMGFVEGMAMLMARRDLTANDALQFRAMLSPDPFMGKRGYPLLLQTGETADGVTHLVDRQHPHDLFM
ncbi:MAG TPA: hypothetical protein VHL34_19820, partial [Rhizomicrobium sp.]|nr:hypothetical protein [Rhizomicrobium sp.]